jgi:3-hydroxyisobutyrate dehydrogenase
MLPLSKGYRVQKIAFLGAGIMGQAMIRNLLKAGFSVTVFNRTVDKARALEPFGAKIAVSPRAAAERADVVMSMLIDDAACRTCWLGPQGVFDAELELNTILIECSTASDDWIREVAGRSGKRGLQFLDCPVAGRPDVAVAGQLNMFVGGDAATLEAVRPVLRAMSKSITHFGPIGSGIAFKLIYNVLGAIHVASLAEAMFAAEAAGLDIRAAAEAFSTGATGSPHVIRHAKYMSLGRHENPVQFSGRNRIKDIQYGVKLTEKVGAQSIVGQAAAEVFGQMIPLGMGDLNDSELVNALRVAHGRSPATKA